MGMRSWRTRIGMMVTAMVLAACGSAGDAPEDRFNDGNASPAPSRPGDTTPPADGELTPGGDPDKGEAPSDADPDKDADPDAPSPPDDPALPAATQTQLIARFAPRLHLHPDDTTRPANVDWYLA